MTHYINKDITVMLMHGTEKRNGFTMIEFRNLLIDDGATIWIKVDTYGDMYTIYGRLLPRGDYRGAIH